MDSDKALKTLNIRSVWLPIILGVAVVAILILTDDRISPSSFQLIQDISPLALVLGLFLLAAKDGVNMLRLKFMSGRSLAWYPVFRVILLWEFAIAVTPPVIGATAVLVFIMYKEGLSLGKALAFTFLLATFDNLFFLTASPLALWFSEGAVLPESQATVEVLDRGLGSLFWLSYGLIAMYTTFMLSAVLLFPKTIRQLTKSIMSLSWLKRWKQIVMKQADDLVLVSQVLKGKKISFWFGLLGITYGVWALKFGVLNVLVSGFSDLTLGDHAIVLGRHLVMWIIMLVSPAPGNAGTAEFIFPAFYEDYLGEYTFICSLLWRLFSFYPYLLFGALLLPGWLRRQ